MFSSQAISWRPGRRGFKSWLQVLASSLGFKSWLQVLASSLGFNSWLQVLASSLGFKSWLQVLASSLGFKSWLQVLLLARLEPAADPSHPRVRRLAVDVALCHRGLNSKVERT